MTRVVANAIGPDTTFDGVATFTSDGDGLALVETGEMRIAGQGALRGERRYRWRQGAAGIEVYFADGRFFHLIGPGDAPLADHDCAPDTYRVAYDFAAWPRWQAVWHVTGPRKDYRMDTWYSLIGTAT